MRLIDILLTVLLIQLVLAAVMTFGSLAWSMFEDTKIGAAISEWIIEKFERNDKE